MRKRSTKPKESRFAIWELDKELDLNDVITNLKLNYRTVIPYLAERSDVSKEDKTLQNGWFTSDGKKDFKIEEIEIANQKISYVKAHGSYELADSVSRSISNGDPASGDVLARRLRIHNHSCHTVFFDYNSRIYVVVEVSLSREGKVSSILFGQGRNENKKEEWKKINRNNVKQFSFDSKFFYWLLSKVGQTFIPTTDKTFKMNLVDVSNVASLTDKNEYDSSSSGSNILGSLPALSGLGSNQSVYQGGFKFLLPKMNLVLRLADDSTCYINKTDSSLTTEEGETVNISDDRVRVSLTIFVVLLLTLKRAFNVDIDQKKWTFSNESAQRKQWALFVIRELCQHNGVDIKDIEKLLK